MPVLSGSRGRQISEIEVFKVSSRTARAVTEKSCLEKTKRGEGRGRERERSLSAVAGEITQQLGALAALPDVLVLIPSTHLVAHNCLLLQFRENLTHSSHFQKH